MARINLNIDPVAFMQSKGFSAHQEISPTSGFSGTFTPEAVFGHWTASAKGSDTARPVIRNHHYHSCTNRAAHTAFGGYKKRQGHGGWGRTAPITEARQGKMTPQRWQYWSDSKAKDDTSSQPNQYGMSFCIDCTIDESISQRQVDAWLAVGAMWLTQSQMSVNYAMHHAVSTDRKIDIVRLIVEGVRWDHYRIYDRLDYWVDQFVGTTSAPAPVPQPKKVKMYAVSQHPTSDGYAIVKPDGGVYNFNSPFYGSAAGHIVAGEWATDMAWHPDGKGYWVLSSGGRIYSFGSAKYKGGCLDPGVLPAGAKLQGAATELAPSLTGNGYRISCDDGGLFTFGDATFLGNVLTADAKK